MAQMTCFIQFRPSAGIRIYCAQVHSMTPIFPSTYSTLSASSLADWIAERYQLVNVRCQFLVRGVGDTYLVETTRSHFILRVYRASHRSRSQIRAEIELLVAAKKAGVSVSYPV